MKLIARVAEMAAQMFSGGVAFPELTEEQVNLAVHLRGNEKLYQALREVIELRLQMRAELVPPADPTLCMQILTRDHELRWVLAQLEQCFTAPTATTGEQPDDEAEEAIA